MLLGEKITVKRTQIIPIERSSTRTIKLRFEYVENFYRMARTITNLNIIYIDESGFNLHITNNYGRAKPGVSPTTEVSASKGRNITLMQAINKESAIYYEMLVGPINALTCGRFLKNLIKDVDISSTVIIMDNARIHHSLIVQEFCDEVGLNILF